MLLPNLWNMGLNFLVIVLTKLNYIFFQRPSFFVHVLSWTSDAYVKHLIWQETDSLCAVYACEWSGPWCNSWNAICEIKPMAFVFSSFWWNLTSSLLMLAPCTLLGMRLFFVMIDDASLSGYFEAKYMCSETMSLEIRFLMKLLWLFIHACNACHSARILVRWLWSGLLLLFVNVNIYLIRYA